MGRVMAIDYGTKRCGIAVTDILQIISTPLTTVETKQLQAFIKDYLSREQVDTIVFGRPLQSDGSPSEVEPYIMQSIKALMIEIPKVTIERCDERNSSKLAMSVLINSGVKKMQRRNKGLIDQTSAAIILQTYMMSKAL